VEKEPALRQFLLLVGGLRALGAGEHNPRLVLDAFLLRSLAVAGYAPALDECAVCGTRSGEPGTPTALRAFGIAAGGLTCPNCRVRGVTTPSAATIALMNALLRGDWIHADASDRRYQVGCSGLTAAYLQWHLEHSIRSLQHVEHA
jgi:DNA repair protein RecO (recombination protein O)